MHSSVRSHRGRSRSIRTFWGVQLNPLRNTKPGSRGPESPSFSARKGHPIVEVTARRVVEGEIRGHFITNTPVRPWLLDEEYQFSPSGRPFIPPPGQPIMFESTSFTSPIYAKLPLHGTHQLHNLSLSLTVISTLIAHPPARSALRQSDLSDHSRNGSILDPPVVLVDGAHNAASAETLASYISELVGRLNPGSKLHITYVLALSCSPPKTPFDTLSPILSGHGSQNSVTKVRIATLRFTPPDDMPWVTSVPPTEIRDTVRHLIRLGDEDVWTAPNDLPVNCQLQRALEWTEAGHAEHDEGKLVVVTGSLYLVADFYRLLEVLRGPSIPCPDPSLAIAD
ncbi:hypothetical protein JVU11DRAFT_3378 [Chiua virens]|nr:hypothetical protein JVU11DRAFT_3378 [Chiua virens]